MLDAALLAASDAPLTALTARGLLESQAALRRYDVVCGHPRAARIPAAAWAAISARLDYAALTVPSAFAARFTGRADEAWSRSLAGTRQVEVQWTAAGGQRGSRFVTEVVS